MDFVKDDFVRHPKKDIDQQWGLGVVVEDQFEDNVKVFFENVATRKTIRTDFVSLEKVDDPGNSALFLNNASYDDIQDRQPFPIVLDKFLSMFEGGFYGPVYLEYERNIKCQMHEFMLSHLDKEHFESVMHEGDYQELISNIKRSYSANSFSLASHFELMKLSTAAKDVSNHEHLCQAFYNLLYGSDSIYQRIEQARQDLQRYEMDKWPLITFPLFIRYPDKYMFIKPEMTQEAASNRGFDIQYSSQVNGSTYQKVLEFSEDLLERLRADDRPELNPRDMIDIQGFMWCSFTKAWNDDVIEKVKQELLNK